MQNHILNSKLLLIGDLTICSVWLLCISHVLCLPQLIVFPLLRIWLSFLTYSRSKLAWCPLGLLTIISAMPVYPYSAPDYDLYLVPIIKISRRCISLFGGNSDIVNGIIQLCFERNIWLKLIWLTGFGWLVGIPLAMYLYRAAKKQLAQASLSLKKSIVLFTYTLIAVHLFSTSFFHTLGLCETIAAGLLLVLLTPILFYKGNTKQFLTQAHTTFFSIMALLAIGYITGIGMRETSIITILTIPVIVYILINRCKCRNVPYSEYLLVAFAMLCFWQAQNTTNGMRVVLLAVSAVSVAVAVVRFIRATDLYWAGAGLFLAVAFAIPILCIGYNPYSILSAKRLYACHDYTKAPNGLLYVRSKEGKGIRDRYHIILPAEYDRINILVPYRPYFKVQVSDEWRIYDIERHEFIGNETYTEILPDGNDRFLLRNISGEFVLDLSESLNRNRTSATMSIINAQ